MPLARQCELATTKRLHIHRFILRNHYHRYSAPSFKIRLNHWRPSFTANAGVGSTRERRRDRKRAYAASFLLLLPTALGLIRVASGVVAALQFGCLSGVHTLLEAISSVDASDEAAAFGGTEAESTDLSDIDSISGSLSGESITDAELRNDLAGQLEALSTNVSVDPEELLRALMTVLATGSLDPRQASQLGPLYVWLTATWLTASLCKWLLAFAMALDPIKSWMFLFERNVHLGLGAVIVRGLVVLLPAFVLPLQLPWMQSILFTIHRDRWHGQLRRGAQQDKQHPPSLLVPPASSMAARHMRASDSDGSVADGSAYRCSMLSTSSEASGCSSLATLSTAAGWRDLSGLVDSAVSTSGTDAVKWRARAAERDSSRLALDVLRVAVLLGTSVAAVLLPSNRSVSLLVRTADLVATAASAAVALAAFLEVWKDDHGYLLVNNAERAIKLALFLLVIRGIVEIAAAFCSGRWNHAWFSCSLCMSSWMNCGFTDTDPNKAYYHLWFMTVPILSTIAYMKAVL
ncbi:hypothetical protein Vretimale_18671 [Volvox reticuliferus]|uniref:Uncharacterized protein n=1 Tax=Volvox reticuliferus TaxID=1737510 RepID=A0A8J4LZ81_9CHLO|nr:hypothetical protein Vretifemale_17205 [Volvox reticuliferus]GIM16044.1 hypothetical protein Vretimale_18671 [Volvox reticuliferus]